MKLSLQFSWVLMLALIVTFTHQLTTNLGWLLVIIGALFIRRLPWKSLIKLSLIPLIPALALFVSVYYFGSHDLTAALVLVSRLYLYIGTSALLFAQRSPQALLNTFQVELKLPATLSYGTLAAINIFPKINGELQRIRLAGQLRGVTFHLWSPALYFKAILAAINWSDQLAQAMESRGFNPVVIDQQRSQARWTTKDWLLLLGGNLLIIISYII
ncbi:energy-coupling factor transporter transmembrane component T family protein [Limosilactobacillus equigenerosi]|uniref:ABC superfamily ATP binding cassette transporter permease protein n=1 Tax=Limosilactobacillus equigenerosi DSM 18793 = JCM 14505 TaxID=1423742 RepID=A0A0R1UYS7_9LACO|nr:energy-coupling factor transporter transmembrane component T [Limosilactobacillus equigenerosi]KRL95051.1 ABC superfamily ATP binding cassette transporter permease protein [Limosilactobacillus equigenerosi DSM 18793 = JCM 14505]